MLERIRAVCLPWIDYGVRRRYFFLYFVMVGDQNGHAKTFGQFCLFHSCNSIVTGQNGIDSFFICIADQVFVDAIAVFHTVRDLHICIGMTATQSSQQNKGGIHAINIIIADDTDFFLFFYFRHQNLYQFICIFQQMRIIKIFFCSVKILPDFRFTYNITVSDQPCSHLVDPEFFCYCLKIGTLCRDNPFFHSKSPF